MALIFNSRFVFFFSDVFPRRMVKMLSYARNNNRLCETILYLKYRLNS